MLTGGVTSLNFFRLGTGIETAGTTQKVSLEEVKEKNIRKCWLSKVWWIFLNKDELYYFFWNLAFNDLDSCVCTRRWSVELQKYESHCMTVSIRGVITLNVWVIKDFFPVSSVPLTSPENLHFCVVVLNLADVLYICFVWAIKFVNVFILWGSVAMYVFV